MFEHLIPLFDQHSDRLRLPEFPDHLDWVNSKPLTLREDLTGQVLVLLFWTYDSVYCQHVLPWLSQLQNSSELPPFNLVGIHAGRSTTTKAIESVQHAINRLGVTFPVVNDCNYDICHQLKVSKLPMVAVLGPNNNLITGFTGEEWRYALAELISEMHRFYEAQSEFSKAPPIKTNPSADHASLLNYPSGICYLPDRQQLCICDSGNNRILLLSEKGQVKHSLSCHNPTGVTYQKGSLFVSDCSEHMIRRIDLSTAEVTPIVGNEAQSYDYCGGKERILQPISTPSDLLLLDKALYFTNTGTHQIWMSHIEEQRARALSGIGKELRIESEHPASAAWAQPMGITKRENELFITEGQGHTIRALHLESGHTRCVADELTGFEHPDGIVWERSRDKLIVADRFNHSIKWVDPVSGKVTLLAGNGHPGHTDGKFDEVQFSEPSRLALNPDGQQLYISDTNNHAIRIVNLGNGETQTLDIQGGDLK